MSTLISIFNEMIKIIRYIKICIIKRSIFRIMLSISIRLWW